MSDKKNSKNTPGIKSDQKTASEKKPQKYIRRVVRGILVFFILTTIAALFGALWLYWQTPSVKKLLSDDIAQTSVIYDRTGTHILYEIHGEENRKVISHEEIPNSVRITSIAAEDAGFYSHPGIDPKAILRAITADVQSSATEQGASTITQQLARNVYLTREKTFKRKLLEIFLAVKIEWNFKKDQILDMYLNDIPYGSNAYGIESAAKTFFGKSAKDLTLDESALLAALPNATTFYSPYGNHQASLLKRQQYILDRVLELGLAEKSDVESAKSVDTLSKIEPFRQEIWAPHFVFYVKEQLEKMYGKDVVERGGLKIITTLDFDKQKLAEDSVRKELDTIGKKYGATNAALVSLNPKTGEILAMVGSRDYFDKSIDGQVNVAISPRQPGSSFKPFAYAAAFLKGYQPETMLWDVPTDFGPDGSGTNYKPNNYDGSFHGLVPMREALAMSLNIPAVKTLYLAGISDTINLAHNLGISTLKEKNRYGLALVLGGGEVTLLDETSGYSVFANDGEKNPPTGIKKIIDSQENTLYESQPKNEPVLDSQIARKISSILSDNNARAGVFGSASKLVIPGRTVAAKTGTTQEFHDAWTVGYTPSLVTGVWVGNNDNQAMEAGADGSYVAAPIWNDFMSASLKTYPSENFPDYDKTGVQKLLSSGELPKLIYFNKNSGKELSDKKRKKTDPDKIGVRVEYPNGASNNNILMPELSDTTDEMILRWRTSIENPESLANLDQKNKNEN